MVVASGEQVTAGLLAITLSGMGGNARSYMGWQLPIRASGHSSALIDHIDAQILEEHEVFERQPETREQHLDVVLLSALGKLVESIRQRPVRRQPGHAARALLR